MSEVPQSAAVRGRWADQNPAALQALVDPSIRVLGDEYDQRWALPAGWVLIVNDLHRGLSALLGGYAVVRVGNKMTALRYAIDRYGGTEDEPGLRDAVTLLMAQARTASLVTCDLCGGPASGAISFGVTRCENHPAHERGCHPGARARPPGFQQPRPDARSRR